MARRTLSQEVKNGILSDLAAGVSPVTIASKFGVSIPTVYNYRKSQTTVTATGNLEVASVTASTGTTPAVTFGTAAPVRATRKSAKASR